MKYPHKLKNNENEHDNLIAFEELWQTLDIGKEANEESIKAFIKDSQRIRQYCREQLTVALSESDNIDFINKFIANIVEFIPSFFKS